MSDTIAFALGGLAGNNAHGAGFLQAILDKKIQPSIISCTSGQIFWVSEYLKQRHGSQDLTTEVKKHIETGNSDLNRLKLITTGKENVFRPAYVEYSADMIANMQTIWKKIMDEPDDVTKALIKILPGRTLVPTFPKKFFSDIYNIFENSKDIGVAFNSYDPVCGVEYIYLNKKAKEQLNVDFDKCHKGKYRQRTEYKKMSAKSVREALWLYQYGFERGQYIFDGAYFRQIMLSELVIANKIYVARPINKKWIGNPPDTYIGLEDLKTETSFNGTYAGERDKIELINKLVKKGDGQSTILDEYHYIDLIEVEIQTQEGFFDYTYEKMEVFNNAREQTLSILE